MKKILSVLTIFLLSTILLSSCGVTSLLMPPTATSSPTSTPTATPTVIPATVPEISLGPRQYVGAGGYSYQPPMDYKRGFQNDTLMVADQTGTLIISITGGKNPPALSEDTLTQIFLGAVFKKGNGTYKLGPATPISIDGINGSKYDVSGTLYDKPVVGQAFAVLPEKSQYLFGLGISNVSLNAQLWEQEGSRVFSALIGSLRIITAKQNSSPCVASVDSTYGFTQDNPIRVGGEDFEGPARERAYLDNLIGASGQSITYTRGGSLSAGGTILDAYDISGLGKAVTLYIDEYAYTNPQAPVGFTCKGIFPLSKP